MVKKVEGKKSEGKKPVAKKVAIAKVTKVEAKPKKLPLDSAYHLKKRPEDGKWEVLRAGGAKAIKLFDTKAEAEVYCKKMAENQGVALHTHASKGAKKGKLIK